MGERRLRARWWQWCAFGLAAVLLAAVGWRASTGKDGIPMATSVLMIDVRSGQLFDMSVARTGLMVPERHPRTGELGLFPVEQGADGAWVIPARMREGLAMVAGGTDGLVDRRTGVVRSNGAPAVRSRPRRVD